MTTIDKSGKALVLDALPNPITRAIFNYKYNLNMSYEDILDKYKGNSDVVDKAMSVIDKAISKHLKSKKCTICGTPFMTNQRRQLCEICRTKRRKESRENVAKQYKSDKIVKKNFKPKKSLTEICRELDKYNKEHNTYLTYGEYVSMFGTEN